jgi:hypothetical protein
MSLSAKELKRWAATLMDDDEVAIDDGGLTLVVLDEDGNASPDDGYLEVGGIPIETDYDEDSISTEMPSIEPEEMTDEPE